MNTYYNIKTKNITITMSKKNDIKYFSFMGYTMENLEEFCALARILGIVKKEWGGDEFKIDYYNYKNLYNNILNDIKLAQFNSPKNNGTEFIFDKDDQIFFQNISWIDCIYNYIPEFIFNAPDIIVKNYLSGLFTRKCRMNTTDEILFHYVSTDVLDYYHQSHDHIYKKKIEILLEKFGIYGIPEIYYTHPDEEGSNHGVDFLDVFYVYYGDNVKKFINNIGFIDSYKTHKIDKFKEEDNNFIIEI